MFETLRKSVEVGTTVIKEYQLTNGLLVIASTVGVTTFPFVCIKYTFDNGKWSHDVQYDLTPKEMLEWYDYQRAKDQKDQ